MLSFEDLHSQLIVLFQFLTKLHIFFLFLFDLNMEIAANLFEFFNAQLKFLLAISYLLKLSSIFITELTFRGSLYHPSVILLL
jgi:hypothetical protein